MVRIQKEIAILENKTYYYLIAGVLVLWFTFIVFLSIFYYSDYRSAYFVVLVLEILAISCIGLEC